MSKRFFPGSMTGKLSGNERGSTTSMLLLLLLLVLSAGCYLFYFTDLIRPAKKAALPQAGQTAQVKAPIPPRPDQPGGEVPAPAKPGEAKPSPGSTTASVAPAPGSAPPPAAVAPPVKPAAESKPVAAAVPAKPEPLKTAKMEAPPKPLPVPAKVPAATAKPAPPQPAATKPAAPSTVKAKPAQKENAATTTGKTAVKPAGASKGGAYTLLIGDFVPGQSIAAIQTKLRKSGISPVSKNSIKTSESMNRLFIAEFTEQDTAEAELQKLKKLTADAFLVVDNGRYNLYAGSYYSESRVNSEVKRLTASGIKPVVKRAQVKIVIKVTRVTAGSFISAEEAGKAVKRLKRQGIDAKVIRMGK